MTQYIQDKLDHPKKEETWSFAIQPLLIFLLSRLEDVLPLDFVHFQNLWRNVIVLKPMFLQVKEIVFTSQKSRKLDKCPLRKVDLMRNETKSALVQNV